MKDFSKNNIEFTLYSESELDENFSKLLEELKTENDVNRINERIANVSGGHFLFSQNIGDLTAILKLYRVTKSYPDLEHNLHQPNSFSHPPNTSTLLGRANLKGHPVFYCSLSPATAIQESRITSNQIFYISEWRFEVTKELNAFFLAYDSENRNGIIDGKIEKAIQIIASNLDVGAKNRMK